MSSSIMSDRFLIQSLTEKNIELQTLNKLLFSKVATLKIRIKELESEFENHSLYDFEIIDLHMINDMDMLDL